MQSNKKTVQVVMMEQESELVREAGVRGRRRRPLSTSLMVEIEDDETVKQRFVWSERHVSSHGILRLCVCVCVVWAFHESWAEFLLVYSKGLVEKVSC